jgi:hypothetical protein
MNTPVENSAKNKVLAAILFVGSLVIFLGVTEVVVGHYEKQNMKVPRLVYYLTYTPCLLVSGLAFANFSKAFTTGNDKREMKHQKR